jgi:hypothetical protein
MAMVEIGRLVDCRREDSRGVYPARAGAIRISGDGFGYPSTDRQYLAVCGKLLRHWKGQGRVFFHIETGRPTPDDDCRTVRCGYRGYAKIVRCHAHFLRTPSVELQLGLRCVQQHKEPVENGHRFLEEFVSPNQSRGKGRESRTRAAPGFPIRRPRNGWMAWHFIFATPLLLDRVNSRPETPAQALAAVSVAPHRLTGNFSNTLQDCRKNRPSPVIGNRSWITLLGLGRSPGRFSAKIRVWPKNYP